MNKNKKMAIIIYSCWKNRDMWEIFSSLFHKYWRDCQYKVILVTDEFHEEGKSYVFDDVVEIDDTWAKMIKKAMQVADTPYVSLWMDDYLLCDYIKNEDIDYQIKRAEKYYAANLRLIESPTCHGRFKEDENLGYYERGKAYSLATQIGIWDREFLEHIVDDAWSAWDYERIGPLSKAYPEQPVLVALDYEIPYEEGVRKGKWMIQGAKLCRRNGIKLNTDVRPIMSNKEMAYIYLKGAILDINPTLVVKNQNLLTRDKRK